MIYSTLSKCPLLNNNNEKFHIKSEKHFSVVYKDPFFIYTFYDNTFLQCVHVVSLKWEKL